MCSVIFALNICRLKCCIFEMFILHKNICLTLLSVRTTAIGTCDTKAVILYTQHNVCQISYSLFLNMFCMHNRGGENLRIKTRIYNNYKHTREDSISWVIGTKILYPIIHQNFSEQSRERSIAISRTSCCVGLHDKLQRSCWSKVLKTCLNTCQV